MATIKERADILYKNVHNNGIVIIRRNDLLDALKEAYTDECNGIIMDNLTDRVAYGG